jgi:hypothetical protein
MVNIDTVPVGAIAFVSSPQAINVQCMNGQSSYGTRPGSERGVSQPANTWAVLIKPGMVDRQLLVQPIKLHTHGVDGPNALIMHMQTATVCACLDVFGELLGSACALVICVLVS